MYRNGRHAVGVAGATIACLMGGTAVSHAPQARADVVAYLVNVTVRPGYNFPNPDAAIAYGRGICDKVAGRRSYREVMADINADFHNPDDYQASYLITQAVNELCPASIWQLRNSAANYRPAAVRFSPPTHNAGPATT